MKKSACVVLLLLSLNAFSQILSPNGDNIFYYNGAADVIFAYPERGSGGRAMVHYPNNILSLNYGSDFKGGTLIGSDVFFKDGGNSYIASGNLGIGTINPSNIQGWDKVLDVAGDHHSKIIATVNDSQYRVGIFAHNETWYGGGGFVGTESNHPLHFITNYTAKMSVLTNGNVGIGTTKPDSKLTVAGNIHAQEVKVTVNAGADFVFDKEYDLPSLESVDQFIKENKHLPEIASASQMQENGINLSEMNIKLLQKIEEMTLYMIQQNKEIIDLKSRLDKVEHVVK